MRNDLKLLQAELESSLAGLSEQQTQLRPRLDSRRWHIQQIVGHLLLTYALTITALETQIAKATPTRVRPSFAERLRQFVVLRLGGCRATAKRPPSPPPTPTPLPSAASSSAPRWPPPSPQ